VRPAPRSDEELDRLVNQRDPVDRSLLSHEDVDAALERLHMAIARDTQPEPRAIARDTQPDPRAIARDTQPEPRAIARDTQTDPRPRRPRRAVFSAALIGALAAGILVGSALLPSNEANNDQLAPTPATAAAVALDRAARAAAQRPQLVPTARQYQYLAVEEASVSGFGEGAGSGPPGALAWGVHVWYSDSKRDWFKPNGSGRERIIETSRRFLTLRDAAIARANHKAIDSILPNQSVDGLYPAGGIAWGYWNPADLPTSGDLLKAVEGKMRANAGGHQPAAADVFAAISELLFDSNSPSQRAALYRALAQLPGVQLLGWRNDRIGRRGLAVAITRRVVKSAPNLRQELLFDPATSDVLQTDEVLVAPFRQSHTPTLRAGMTWGYTVFLARGIVNSFDELPGGGRLPYHPSIGPSTR